ncbi:MAG: sugar phosphate isomerase/epimerase [Candidatus Aminicenantes bacterium]|nr:sugar phosphate isomerase/epimerase [Candidatus Aminicenantes bacterium]
MPFDNYFVRISCELLRTDYKEFLDLGISPEVYMDSFNLNSLIGEAKENFKSIIEKFNSNTIHAPFLDISTGGNDDDIRELSFKKLSKVLELGREWGSDLVVIHYNYDRLYYRQSLDGWLDRSTEFFKRLSTIPDHPIIAIENIDDPVPDVALELERRTGNERIIHCFDYGHHNVFGKISSGEWLKHICSDKKIHFHFHDNNGLGDDHLPMGEGKIDWEKAHRDILALGIQYSVTLEPHSKADLIRSLQYYRKHFLQEESAG